MINLQLSGTKDDTLLNLLVKAHQDAARSNPNASTNLCVVATAGSGDFTRGVIAGLASIGGQHAPLAAAREVYIYGISDEYWGVYRLPKKIPGFGNSFYKDKVDPAFQPVLDHIKTHHRPHYNHLATRTSSIRSATGRKLYPNAAIITAVVCEILEIPDGMESLIFMMARIPIWAEASCQTTI